MGDLGRLERSPVLDPVEVLAEHGASVGLDEDVLAALAGCRLRPETMPLAIGAVRIARDEQPLTLRGLFYRLVSAGMLPSTDKPHYEKLLRLTTLLREREVVPFAWLVDHVRETLKPSSWSGLQDFAETTRYAYRRDYWAELPTYVHVFVEKDAMAGVLQPVTEAFDVALSVLRGFPSISFAHDIAEQWAAIEKPIVAFYFGDHDPSGCAIEDTIRTKIHTYMTRIIPHGAEADAPLFAWERLGVVPEDFDAFDLHPLPVKGSDPRAAAFRAHGHEACAELDAIPADELRGRLRDAITSHLPDDGSWERLQRIERLERQTWDAVVAKLPKRMGGRR